MFPKFLMLLFLGMTVLTSIGAAVNLAGQSEEEMPLGDKAWEFVRLGLDMPNAADDFTASAIRYAIEGPPEDAPETGFSGVMQKYYYVVLIVSVLGLLFLFKLFYELSKWFLGLGRPAGSAERSNVIAILIAIALFGFLTGFDFIRALIGVL